MIGRSKWLSPLLSVLVAGAVACNVALPSPAPTQPPAPQPAAQEAAGRGNAGGAARVQTVNGVLADLGGQRLTVTSANGPVQVALGTQTRLTKFDPVKLSDLQAGDTISIRASTDTYGNLLADTVQIFPERPAAGQGQAGPAQGQRAQGGSAGTDSTAVGGAATRGQGGAGGGQGGATARPQGAAAGGAQAGAQGGGGAARTARGQRAGLTGQVQKVEGTAVIFTDQTGPQIFIVNGGTSFSRSNPATVADLRIGARISIMGAAGADGVIAAASITLGDELAAQ